MSNGGSATGKSQASTATTAFADFNSAVGASESTQAKSAVKAKKPKKKKGTKSIGKKAASTDKGVIQEEDERIEADIVLDEQTMVVHAPMTQPPVVGANMDKKAIRKAFLERPPNQIVSLIKSQFGPAREPWLFFPYPPFLKI